MMPQNAQPAGARSTPWDAPWLFLTAGVATTATSWLLFAAGEPTVAWPLLLVGLLATAKALTVRRPTAKLVLTAALVPVLTAQAVDSSWDSLRLVCYVAAAVAVVAAGLLALPQRLQRLALSVLVSLHFGAIIMCILSNTPADAPPSWLASQVHAGVFKPYLEFLYLQSSFYGFYSHGDRPRTTLWLYLTYADGEHQWIKLPESDGWIQTTSDLRLMDLAWDVEGADSAPPSAALRASRKRGGKQFTPPMPEPADDQEYQEPSTYSKALLASIARHAAGRYAHPSDPEQPVAGIKIYRVNHTFLNPADFCAGADPNDPTTYFAYYLGDFQPDGQLNPACSRIAQIGGQDVELRGDPLLYWLIPVVQQDDGALIDYMQLHANRGN